MKRSTPPKLSVVDVTAALGEPGERPGKPERINFLVTPAEKAEILEESESRGLTITEYFLRLHRRVREVGSGERSRKRP